MKKLCHNPFIGLDIDPSGKIRPCCKFLNNQIPYFNVNEGIAKYQNSDFLKKLRSDFLAGESPKGCQRCWIEEDAGIQSKRQLDYERHKESLDPVDIQQTDFKNISLAFGNLCNLACRICGPYSSSRWASEKNKMGGKRFPIHDWFKNEAIMEDIFNNTKKAFHFDIPGGEPFLTEIPEHFQFLSRFPDDQAKKISIHYTTNGTNLPDEGFLVVWDRFKEIDIQISIDDTGKRFEYNRWPADWSLVYRNIKRLQQLEKDKSNIRLSISFTVSAFTILYSQNFYEWCLAEGLPSPWMGRLDRPEQYSPEVLPVDRIQHIKKRMASSRYDDIKKLTQYLTGDKQDLLPKFRDHVRDMDKIRNQDFRETFPELVEVVYG